VIPLGKISKGTNQVGKGFLIMVASERNKNKEERMNVLKGRRGNPIVVHVSVMEGKTGWTSNLAKRHLVNETSLQLCSMIINEHNKSKPLKTWGGATSYYTWLENIKEIQHCMWLIVILVKREEIQLQKSDKIGWFSILSKLEKMIVRGGGKEKLNQIKDPTSLLYPMVGKEVIDIDISPPKPTTKRNKNSFEISVV
jgi:hypothetical protein